MNVFSWYALDIMMQNPIYTQHWFLLPCLECLSCFCSSPASSNYGVMLICCFRYEKYHVYYGGEEEERKSNYTDMVMNIKITPVVIWFQGLWFGGWLTSRRLVLLFSLCCQLPLLVFNCDCWRQLWIGTS